MFPHDESKISEYNDYNCVHLHKYCSGEMNRATEDKRNRYIGKKLFKKLNN